MRASARRSGAEPPVNYVYEMFLDQHGEKISKTKGNGISVEQWLAYAAPESLSLYNFQKPRTAKKLYFDVIPKAVDEYLAFVEAYAEAEPRRALGEPGVAHPCRRAADATCSPISFALLTESRLRLQRRDEGVALGVHRASTRRARRRRRIRSWTSSAATPSAISTIS